MYSVILAIISSGAFLAVVGWAANIGNRVTKIETRQEDLPALITAKFDAVEQRLDRIERAMNGNNKHD
jgi:hypothetical protein